MAIEIGESKYVLGMSLLDLDTGKEVLLFEREGSRCHFYEDIFFQDYIITLRVDWNDIRDTDPVLDADIYQNNAGKKGKKLRNGPWHHTLKTFNEITHGKLFNFSFHNLKLNLSAKTAFALVVGMDVILVKKGTEGASE